MTNKLDDKAATNAKLGTSDFIALSNSDLFVDKSLFIRAIFDEGISLITAPSKFGKSTNMNMLKMFLEIEVDKKGRPISNSLSEETTNCKFFKDRNLNIYKSNKKFFYDNCGAHPVMYVNFKSLPVDKYESFLNSFRIVLNKIFRRYGYLVEEKDGKLDWSNNNNNNDNNDDDININTSPKIDIAEFLAYYDQAEILKLDEVEIVCGLTYLSRVLKEYFGKKVFVLIEEYDAPIFKTIYENSSSSETERIFDFIGLMIGDLLKSNECVERALINSRLQLARVLSPLANNIITYEFLGKHPLSEFYGFTTSEMDKHVQNKNKRDNIKQWYEGYTVLGKEYIKIHNPWSVANYLASRRLDKYWALSVGTDRDRLKTFTHPKIRERVDAMMLEDNETIRIHTPIMSVGDIKSLKFIMTYPENEEIGIEHSDLFFQFFCDCGYFDVVKKRVFDVEIRIPNLEIRNFFHEYLRGTDVSK